MRIVVLGGVPRSLINFRGPMLRRMVKNGREVFACAPDADTDVQADLGDLGVEYRHIPINRAGMNPVGDLATLLHLRRLFVEIKPDLVLAYTIKPVIWGLLAARLARVPRRFAMITGLGYAFLDNGRVRQRLVQRAAVFLYRQALKDAEGVFFQNPNDQEEFCQRGLMDTSSRQMRIHGSGVDLTHFQPAPVPEQPVFLLLARLIADKGIREYLAAARQLKASYPQARFLLAGPMDTNPSAIDKTELEQWQAEGTVEYLGNLSDVRQSLAQCSVYVLPSFYREGTPRTVLEAMATGRAIITTDAPGCRETVDNGVNGYLIPPRNTQALADAMERLIQDPEKRVDMGAESLRLARERYDVDKVNEVILQGLGL